MDLVMKNVSYSYRKSGAKAVKGVDCAFESGLLYAIMGPSGSGKSTLLSMLAGLDLPSEGEIRFGNDSLKDMDLDRYRREDVSMVFQAYQLFPLLTAEENVCFPMELKGINKNDAKAKAEECLVRVGITTDKFKSFPANLSGGEQQRVAIARSLASGARVILADEPTGNLDVENSENIMEILVGLARGDGYCVIVVTHDIDVANKADVLFKMRDGVMVLSENE
jgi:putative ABC transport system ATP-binding protein